MGTPYTHTTLYTQYHVPVLDRGTEAGQVATVEEMLLEEQTVELMCNQLLGWNAQYESASPPAYDLNDAGNCDGILTYISSLHVTR